MTLLERLLHDHDRFRSGLPQSLENYILETYGLDLSSTYGIHPIRNPFGKASGQLSLNTNQIKRDVEAGLGFVVLKTVIAQDASGAQSMKAWAIPEARMTIERITGTRPAVQAQEGWTVSWKGRGWSDTFEQYLSFFRESLELARDNMLIVPSCKYHLPTPEEDHWKTEEYEYTTMRLLETHRSVQQNTTMPIEKDFSPTLAGDANFSKQKENIFHWLCQVPILLRNAAKNEKIAVGLKLFNATFSDDFQQELLQTCITVEEQHRADYLIYGNRLFDPARMYDGKQGIAYGGPDLSDRNLSALQRVNVSLPLSATGDITTGEMAFRYLACGATSFQMHTLFQLPDREFTMIGGTRTARALHRLLFHPEQGFLKCFISLVEREQPALPITIPAIAQLLLSNKSKHTS